MRFQKKLWATPVIFIIIILFMFNFESCCGCLEQEMAALVQLNPIFRNYSSRDYCNDWDEVTCDANGRVISLSITNSYTGEFNASVLLPFEQLQQLDLHGNSITRWTETKGLKKLSSSLTKLEDLQLYFNKLDANILSHLSGFHSLKQLYLYSNNISGMILVSDIEAMKNLEVLDLFGNAIYGFMSHDSGSVNQSPSISKLHTLRFSFNNLSMSTMSHLRRFQSIKTLFINRFSGGIQLNGLLADINVFDNLEVLDIISDIVSNVSLFNDYGKLSPSLPKLKTLRVQYSNLDSNFLPHLSVFPSLATLDLSGNNFGELRLNDFEGMKNLEEIHLLGNNIKGIITDGPVKLSQLKLLNLRNNALNSSSIQHLRMLPSSLKHLWLDFNKIEGFIDFQDIVRIKNLEDLSMSLNNILGFKSSNGCNSTSLQKLDVSHNQISRDISSCLGSLTNLRALNLSGNHLTGNVGKYALVSPSSLEVLQISQNQFLIPKSFKPFFNHTKLKYFVGDSNQVILDDSETDLVSGLKLEVLLLSKCAINGPLPNFLRHQNDLRYIDLGQNSLQGNFPSWLMENNPQLSTLLLPNNSLTGALEVPFHAYLWELDISHNKIGGSIPSNMGLLLPQLTILGMSSNHFQRKIPSTLCDLKSLKVLDLSNNHLSGGVEFIGRGCFQLETLDTSNNHLEGEIPPFRQLSSLRYLNLGGNNLFESIPIDTLDLSNLNLQFLILSNNSLEGHLTRGICGLQLLFLDLSYNKLNGSVPSCLTRSSIYLYLNNNRFNGHLVLEFGNYSELETLDLRYNKLSGPIPKFVDSPLLSALLLKGNHFEGHIPSELCKLSSLALLDLSHNNLTGPIPRCLGQMTPPDRIRLMSFGEGYTMMYNSPENDIFKILGLYGEDGLLKLIKDQVDFTTKSMNYNYQGDILKYMSGVDLSCNRLTGEVPLELGNLNWVHALNLSYNQLRGHIPATFSNLTQMESLDLSYNNLNGRIPSDLLKLNFLEVFKVGYNNLSGKIPYEAHSMTFDAISYEGNPLLCGPPLSQNCSHGRGEFPPFTQEAKDVDDDDDGWIDIEAFYVTFAGSFVTMFLAAVVIMWVNPNWRRAWFYLLKVCIFSCYYFLEDTIRKFTRARRV